MKSIRLFVKHIWHNKWLYLLVFCIAFFSDDSYWTATSGNRVLAAVRYLFVFSIPIIFFLLLKVRLNLQLLSLVLFLSIAIFISSILSNSGVGGPLMLAFTFLAAAFIVREVRLKLFSSIFCNLVIVMILYSFVLQMLLLMSVIQVHSVENVIGSSVWVYGGCVFHSSSYGLIMRNGCFFREPGVFMVYICMAYLLDIWQNKKGLNIKKQLLYFLGVFSTMSTAGVIIWGILFLMNALRGKALTISNAIAMFVVLIAAFFVFSNQVLYNNVFAKLSNGTKSASVLSRVSSISIPLKMTLESPFYGCGTERYREEYIRCGQELYQTKIDPQGLATNTILNASAIYGLWYGVLLLLGLLRFTKKIVGNNVIGFFLSFLSLMMMFSNESMQYSLIIYIFLLYGLTTNVVDKQAVAPKINK